MASSCAPCVFGAVSSSLLSFPIALGTVDVQIIPQITIGSNGSAATSFVTTTLAAATQAGGAAVSTVTFTDSSQLTWTTLGATLTYPTTYVDYAAFAGAAATTGCANTLNPSLLTLPPSVPTASLIYPLDNTGALPAGLISFLDGAGGIPSQLNGDQIPQCAPLPGALAISGSISSVITAIATATSGPITVSTNIPPPTTFTSESTRSFTSLATVAASNAVTQASGILFNTVTAGPVVYSGGVSTSLPAALGQSLGSSASKSLSSVLSSLSSLSSAKASSSSIKSSQTGIFTNTTSGQTQPSSRPTIPPTASSVRPSSGIVPSSSKTSGPAIYSGAAVRLPVVSNSIVADIFGFLAFMLYI